MSMLVKLGKEQRMSGPNGSFGPGAELVVDDELAEALVLCGATIIKKITIDNPKEEPIKEPEEKRIETAMVEPPRKMVMPKPQPRVVNNKTKKK